VHASQLRLASGFKGPVITQLTSDVSQLRFSQQILDTQMVTQEQIKWLKFVSGSCQVVRISDHLGGLHSLEARFSASAYLGSSRFSRTGECQDQEDSNE
jgi:hypothetical protein